MHIRHLCLMVALACCGTAAGDAPASATASKQVTALLREFIGGAGGRDPGLYYRFFADDVVYTRSTGAFTTKSMIMENVRKPSSEPPTQFSL